MGAYALGRKEGRKERRLGRREEGRNPCVQLLKIPMQMSISLHIMTCQIEPVTKSVYKVLNNKPRVDKIISPKLGWRNSGGQQPSKSRWKYTNVVTL